MRVQSDMRTRAFECARTRTNQTRTNAHGYSLHSTLTHPFTLMYTHSYTHAYSGIHTHTNHMLHKHIHTLHTNLHKTTYIGLQACVHIHSHTLKYTHYIDNHAQTLSHKHTHTHTHVFAHTIMFQSPHIHILTATHTHIHTRIHMHTHQNNSDALSSDKNRSLYDH